MSRDSYGGRAPQRFDGERFTRERDHYEERGGDYGGRPQERVVDEVYERRSGGGRVYEDDRVRERDYYDEGSRHKPRRESVTIEKEREREVYSPPAAQRAPPRPGLLRRQSSLDTFDRKPFPRYQQREEYGPPALRSDYRPAYVPPPIPRYQQLAPPPRRYAERDYEEIKIAEGDGDYRPYPERVVEREVIRTRRRSRSRSRSVASRASSVSSVSSEEVVVKKFPKRGKTRMPARLVSIKAIIELGYPYEKEGDVIIIQKALGPENIDEVVKLSETYKRAEKSEMSGGRSEGGNIVEEHREEIIDIPARNGYPEIIEKRVYDRRTLSPPRSRIRSRSVGPAPVIVDAREPIEIIDRSRYAPSGPLVLLGNRDSRDSRAVKAELRALEYEKEAMKAEAKAQLELRRAEKIREYGRNGELVLYDEVKVRKDRLDPDVIIKVKREREPDEGVIIKRDKKAAQARAIRTMLTTLT